MLEPYAQTILTEIDSLCYKTDVDVIQVFYRCVFLSADFISDDISSSCSNISALMRPITETFFLKAILKLFFQSGLDCAINTNILADISINCSEFPNNLFSCNFDKALIFWYKGKMLDNIQIF